MARKNAERKGSALDGFSFIKSADGISEYRLDTNGLQVLLVPDASSPVVGVMVTYHVGSRNEATGHTGATHLLEHLMFKGSERFNKDNGGVVWTLLEDKGARVNATTWLDRTNYYAVMPKELVATAITFEADRMRNAFINESDRQSEMPVVRNEFEIGENRPLEALDKQIWAAAFQAHPYHHSTIGWRSDIENVPIERLKQFYQDFYRPDNATVTVVGGFTPEEVLPLIATEFGAHPAGAEPLRALYTTEPKQEGERRVTVKRASETNIVGIAHKIPEATHKDVPALLILALILAEGKTSLMHRALVDTAKALDVSATCNEFHDPSLFITYVTLAPHVKHADIEKLVKKIYADIAEKGVTASELARAKQSVRSYLAGRRDGAYRILSSLNEEIAAGDWTRFVSLPEALAKVSTADVRRVMKQYAVEETSTIGYFIGQS